MSLNQYALNLAFTKAELKVIHNNLLHDLVVLSGDLEVRLEDEEAKIIRSILNKIKLN